MLPQLVWAEVGVAVAKVVGQILILLFIGELERLMDSCRLDSVKPGSVWLT